MEDSVQRSQEERLVELLGQLQEEQAEVVGSEGDKVGNLKSVRKEDFLLDRGMLRSDVYLPVAAIETITEDNRIVLSIPADRVDEMGREEEG